MNILSIGNSFSQDATYYLHDLALHSGVELTTANLYIGGCPLEKHFRNFYSDERAYQLQFNGYMTGFFVSLKEALLSRSWDIITIQQVSSRSGKIETYFPYLDTLAQKIRFLCPKAKLVIHQVWMYEEGASHYGRLVSYSGPDEMYAAISDAYAKATERIGADGMIPSGDTMYRLSKSGVGPIHRDGGHANALGKYAIAMTWLRYLTGVDVSDNDYTVPKEALTEEATNMVKTIVNSIPPMK
ncbi:MAG: DUF4886 domain-containing protein [Clostridia bacterium]|nr:DUF4886 domain-containing protein [Clostridia bacterium]